MTKELKALVKSLTNKQKMFCIYYVVEYNATDAAIKAGYSVKTADVIGCENLTKPKIKEYIDHLIAEKATSANVSALDILKQLNTFRNANIADYLKLVTVEEYSEFNKGQMEGMDLEQIKAFKEVVEPVRYQTIQFKDFDELTRDQTACIESIKMGTRGIELKLHGKDWSIDKICKNLGFYDKDNKLIVDAVKPFKIEFT